MHFFGGDSIHYKNPYEPLKQSTCCEIKIWTLDCLNLRYQLDIEERRSKRQNFRNPINIISFVQIDAPLKMINIWSIFVYFIIIQQKGHFHISQLILKLYAFYIFLWVFPFKSPFIWSKFSHQKHGKSFLWQGSLSL